MSSASSTVGDQLTVAKLAGTRELGERQVGDLAVAEEAPDERASRGSGRGRGSGCRRA